MLSEFAAALDGSFHQGGRCVYADRVRINLIHETGRSSTGDPSDDLAVCINRPEPDGKANRMWTVDLDNGVGDRSAIEQAQSA